MIGWINKWTNEWLNEWMNEWMNKWMNEQLCDINHDDCWIKNCKTISQRKETVLRQWQISKKCLFSVLFLIKVYVTAMNYIKKYFFIQFLFIKNMFKAF